MNKVFKKITLSVLGVFIFLFASLQLPFVQKHIVNNTVSFLQTTHNVHLKMNEVGGIWPFTFKADKVTVGTKEITSHLKTVFISLDVWSTLIFRPKIKFIQIKESLFTVQDLQQKEEKQDDNPEIIINNILMLIKQTYIKHIEMDHIQVNGFESCILACRYKPIEDGSHFTLAPVGCSSLLDVKIHHKDDLTIAMLDYDTKNVACLDDMTYSVFKNVPKSVQQYTEKLKKLSLILKVKDFNIKSLTADFKTKAHFVDGDVDVTATIQDGK